MGLEQSEIFDEVANAASLDQAKAKLLSRGWRLVNFGFSLDRKRDALDIQNDNRRHLIYISHREDREIYQLMKINGIAHFDVNYFPGNDRTDEQLGVANIPSGTRALDSMRFPDQNLVTGHIGSGEIMIKTAQLLANIYRKLGMLPSQLKLNMLALVPASEDPIKLVPPIQLNPVDQWLLLVEQLASDLQDQDPYNNHRRQLEIFQQYFEEVLKND